MAARPDIDQRVEQLVSKGRWQVPGYKVRFNAFAQEALPSINTPCRRNSATFPCCRGGRGGSVELFVYIRANICYFHNGLLPSLLALSFYQLHLAVQNHPPRREWSCQRACRLVLVGILVSRQRLSLAKSLHGSRIPYSSSHGQHQRTCDYSYDPHAGELIH